MCNWNTVDEEWQQRTTRLFQRSVNEPDITESKRLWDIASKSESNRLEWSYRWKQEEEGLIQPPQPINTILLAKIIQQTELSSTVV